MRLHFLAIPVFDPAEGESELNRFLSTHRIIALDRQLVSDGPRNHNLGFRLAREQEGRRSLPPDPTSAASVPAMGWRKPSGPRRASSGCSRTVEPSPGAHLFFCRRSPR